MTRIRKNEDMGMLWLRIICAMALLGLLYSPAKGGGAAYRTSGNVTSTGQWSWLDGIPTSGLPTEDITPSNLFFADSLRGVLTYGPDDSQLVTDDGGRSWTAAQTFIPIPYQMRSETFGFSRSGFVTVDGGATWTSVVPKSLVPDSTTELVDFVAIDRTHWMCIYQERVKLSNYWYQNGPSRIGYTADGEHWVRGDSLLSTMDTMYLDSATDFGVLPSGYGYASSSAQWLRFAGVSDDGGIWVLVDVDRGGTDAKIYFGRLEFGVQSATWQSAPPVDWFFDAATVKAGFAGDTVKAIWMTTLDGRPYFMMQSVHGDDWQELALPDWLRLDRLRMFGRVGTSSNGRTTDGGRSWTMWSHPFTSTRPAVSSAPTATDVCVANEYSLFARTTDGGRTWRSNAAGGEALCAESDSGTVYVGRTYGSLLVSSDSGATWIAAHLPPATSAIFAIHTQSGSSSAGDVLALAIMRPFLSDAYAAILASTDRGRNWSQIGTVPMLDSLLQQDLPNLVLPIGFAETDSDRDDTLFLWSRAGLLRSFDGGVNWRLVSSESLSSLVVDGHTSLLATVNDKSGVRILKSVDAGDTFTESLVRTVPGRGAPIVAHRFGPGHCEFLIPNTLLKNGEWDILDTWDGGDNWSVITSDRSYGSVGSHGIALDTNQFITVGRFGIIQTSTDGGYSFHVRHDSVGAFGDTQSPLSITADNRALYLFTRENVGARWNLPADAASLIPDSFVLDAKRPFGRLRAVPNVVETCTGRLRLEVSGHGETDDDLRLTMVDARGVAYRVHTICPWTTTATGLATVVDCGGLESGRYWILAQDRQVQYVTSIVVQK